ncbi:MAG: 9-O-acetylesterase [Verrucomicrobia bacterium]|nr:9-O-acetylesterase [Verrucomicrobiota bacterium]
MPSESMKPSSIFNDNMVLQQGRPVPVWGRALPREKITVTLNGQTVRGTANKDGKWQVQLAPLKAGGPFDMKIEGRDSAIALKNVLVGEVWIASGQSNMAFQLSGVVHAEREISNAAFGDIRLFTLAQTATVDVPQEAQGCWNVCAPKAAGNFSAVAYFFGRELHRKLGVPIGLINTSWGGTLAEAWTSREMLRSLPQFKKAVAHYEKNLPDFERANANYLAKVKEGEEKFYPADPGNLGFEKGWAAPQTDLSDWGKIRVPCYWQGAGMDFSGVLWFRRDVTIPAEWAGKELTLNLCPCDKYDTTYFNNVKVGEMGPENPNAWATPRAYKIPAGLAKPGRNTLAVRVYSHAYAGGIMGSAAGLNLGPADIADAARIPLAGTWQYRIEHNFGKITPLALQQPLGPGNPNSPYILFNGMIQPLIPYAIRGAIWYQGESNVPRAGEYRKLFPAMIRSWRQAWRQGEPAAGTDQTFPFLFVQLANYLQTPNEPEESAWAELREAQLKTLKTPGTGMAVAIDVGEAADIHPKNKQDIGQRLALNALNHVYGLKEIVPSGPLFSEATVEGNKIRIRFTQTGGGLLAKGGPLTGFAIAGKDRKFVWATAKIVGDAVLVASRDVPKPVAVRYAWANNPACNLYNKAGLPASPFRTDNWPQPSPVVQ